MFTKRILATFFIIAICLTAFFADRSFCNAALILDGQLCEHGEKLSAEQTVKMTLRIYDDKFGGQLLFEENQVIAAGLGKSLFTFEKGDITVRERTSSLAAETMWVEVESNGQVMTPRLSLAEIGTVYDLAGSSLSLAEASLRTAGEPTLIIDNDGVTLGSLLNMGSQFINLGGEPRDSWEVADDSITDAKLVDGAVLAEILDDDGPGSNLDADTLDGKDSIAFADINHTHDSSYYTQAQVDSLVNTVVATLGGRIATLETLLANVSRVSNNLYFDSMNVHVRNGSGTTDGTVNGLGNLIVGYNELRGSSDDRTGSHNLVVGTKQNFTSYGGLVAGGYNTISGPFSSVSGGSLNSASGVTCSVSGGIDNTASGNYTSVSGGDNNAASDFVSVQ